MISSYPNVNVPSNCSRSCHSSTPWPPSMISPGCCNLPHIQYESLFAMSCNRLTFAILERQFAPNYVMSKPEGHGCLSFVGVDQRA